MGDDEDTEGESVLIGDEEPPVMMMTEPSPIGASSKIYQEPKKKSLRSPPHKTNVSKLSQHN